MKKNSNLKAQNLDAAQWIGYLRYSGKGVEGGLMDARKSAHALIGFDGALRHFLSQEAPALRNVEYEIPVVIRPGSWEAMLPANAPSWMMTALGVAGTAYMGKAAAKMAEHDFKGVGVTTIFRRSLKCLQSVIRLGKHLGTLHTKQFPKVKWNKEKALIGIPNEKGEHLYVPKSVLDSFACCPPGLFSDMAAIIQNDRELQIGEIGPEGVLDVEITEADRHIFYVPETEDEILFPELQHGQAVELEGVVTRGNENSNSIGFQYQGHILACYPTVGSIVRFKSALFLKCRIKGVINRADDIGGTSSRCPKIFFEGLVPIEKEPHISDLFAERG